MRFVMRFYSGKEANSGIDLEKTEERMEKYRARGFRIEHHPLNDQIIEHITSVMKTPNSVGIEAVDRGLINLDQFFVE
ncbi:Hypothetical protein POVR1_LOCUS391 [uncultured virus]|nr:Hypothetical protein POVR1_LOCUS391 [uncultured virus]